MMLMLSMRRQSFDTVTRFAAHDRNGGWVSLFIPWNRDEDKLTFSEQRRGGDRNCWSNSESQVGGQVPGWRRTRKKGKTSNQLWHSFSTCCSGVENEILRNVVFTVNEWMNFISKTNVQCRHCKKTFALEDSLWKSEMSDFCPTGSSKKLNSMREQESRIICCYS